MSRPVGVIISAVLAILGSIGAILLGFLSLAALSFVEASPAVMPKFIYFFPMVLFASCGVWGLWTGIALFRMRPWARVSMLVFSGMLVGVALFGVFVVWAFGEVAPPVDAEALRAARWGVGIFYFALFLLGTIWLIYFTRKGVKQAFLGDVGVSQIPRLPLSITIIGWYLATSAPLLLVLPLLKLPASIFGFILTGWSAAAIHLLYGIAGLAAGVGLLKRKVWAYTLTVWYFAFSIVNVVVFALIPGAQKRMEEFLRNFSLPGMEGMPRPEPPPVWTSLLTGFLLAALPLWFLISRKEKFLAAAKPAPDSAPPR